MKVEFRYMLGALPAVLCLLLGQASAQAGHTAGKKAATHHMGATIWSDTQGAWAPVPVFPKGAELKVMKGNPRTGAADMLVKFPAGYGVPLHWHTAWETVYVQAGTLELHAANSAEATSINAPALFQAPPRMVHSATCTSKEDCYFFLHSSGPLTIHLVGDQGKK